eukprot:24082_1
MAYCICLLLLSSIVNGRLQDNPSFKEINCASFITKSECSAQSQTLCRWNSIHSICKANYNPIIFISAFDIAAISKSLISFLLLIACLLLYAFSGLITRKWKLFKNVDPDKLKKCQLYIFELIGLTLCLSFIIYYKTYNIIFNPDSYPQFAPTPTLRFIRSIAAFVFIMYMYLIEMLTSTLRWSVKLHHIITMVITMYVIWIMDEYVDLAALRCALCLSLYPITEHNVCLQLLLYRIAPLSGWHVHLASAIIYLSTRLLVTGLFIYCYIDWAKTEAIANEFSGTPTTHYPYLIFFFLLPLAVILINIAQFETAKALFYVAKSVFKKHKERKELMYYPRLQELYDLFLSFDSEQNGSWGFDNFKTFVNHYSSFINEDTCIILWNVLGFAYEPVEKNVLEEIEIAPTGWMDKQREERVLTPRDFDNYNVDTAMLSVTKRMRKGKMKWRHFGKIFGQYVISKKFAFHSVETVVGAQIQILLQTVFDVQQQFQRHGGAARDKEQAIMSLYTEIDKLVDGKKKKKTSTLPEEMVWNKHNAGVCSIEMILSPTSFIKEDDGTDDDQDTRRTVTMPLTDDDSANALRGATTETADDDRLRGANTETAVGETVMGKWGSTFAGSTKASPTDALRGTDDLGDHDWNAPISLDDKKLSEEEEGDSDEERREQDMLFRIMMHGPDGKPNLSSDEDDDEYEDDSVMVHARTIRGTFQAAQKMLDDDEINEWI